MPEEVLTPTPPETVEPPAPEAAEAPKPPMGKKKKKKSHKVRNTIIALVVIAALAVGGYFLWKFLSKPEEVASQLQTATADWGSITSSVQGSGIARAKESTAITLQNAGIVQNLYISEGQMINEGDPLYEIVSPAAQTAYDAAVKNLEDAQKELSETGERNQKRLKELQDGLDKAKKDKQKLLEDQTTAEVDRFIKAPFAGQLQQVTRFNVGDHVAGNPKVATLVDDSKFKAAFYFSYGYEGKISVGQSVQVTVNNTTLTGKVEEVTMVRRVSPEGTLLFEALVVVDNPGALTKGLTATASLVGADGVAIYPYDAGTLDYYRTTDIYAKTEGDVVNCALRDYVDVTAGQVLMTLSPQDFSESLSAADDAVLSAQEAISQHNDSVIQERETKAQQLEELQKKVEEAQKALDDFSAVAPMSGTIMSCSLSEGQEVKSGDTVVTISNNTTMMVTIQVDDRNIAYVKPGMTVNLEGNGMTFMGTVTKIDMSLSGDAMGNGMTNYPVTLEVDNFDGSLLEGMWLSYSFVTSQSDNCIVVPQSSVKYVGEDQSVVFIQADAKPENAVEVEIPPVQPGEVPKYPSPEDGYYAVPVTTGLFDSYNVEITEGLQGGETIFLNYLVEQAWGG